MRDYIGEMGLISSRIWDSGFRRKQKNVSVYAGKFLDFIEDFKLVHDKNPNDTYNKIVMLRIGKMVSQIFRNDPGVFINSNGLERLFSFYPDPDILSGLIEISGQSKSSIDRDMVSRAVALGGFVFNKNAKIHYDNFDKNIALKIADNLINGQKLFHGREKCSFGIRYGVLDPPSGFENRVSNNSHLFLNIVEILVSVSKKDTEMALDYIVNIKGLDNLTPEGVDPHVHLIESIISHDPREQFISLLFLKERAIFDKLAERGHLRSIVMNNAFYTNIDVTKIPFDNIVSADDIKEILFRNVKNHNINSTQYRRLARVYKAISGSSLIKDIETDKLFYGAMKELRNGLSSLAKCDTIDDFRTHRDKYHENQLFVGMLFLDDAARPEEKRALSEKSLADKLSAYVMVARERCKAGYHGETAARIWTQLNPRPAIIDDLRKSPHFKKALENLDEEKSREINIQFPDEPLFRLINWKSSRVKRDILSSDLSI